ncbi:hypothetical protein [Undibacterium oligocarboniphilum]|uniref:Uncharacterized protein n=1 Tax=Undibacterium oligocarboniphilum TaxID=666702 RepID=A0A850QJP0_9BURK|nr:hypothetical protein [Undibacterium oligocarboniphilum]MBC3871208.1 hypothetical protein [Undibacterium oligocarboniphilum]NVO79299.1 hypothetical protein [Undibacterium oligocarboniphilum]
MFSGGISENILGGSIFDSPYFSLGTREYLHILPIIRQYAGTRHRIVSTTVLSDKQKIHQFFDDFFSETVENLPGIFSSPRILLPVEGFAPCYFAEQHVE